MRSDGRNTVINIREWRQYRHALRDNLACIIDALDIVCVEARTVGDRDVAGFFDEVCAHVRAFADEGKGPSAPR